MFNIHDTSCTIYSRNKEDVTLFRDAVLTCIEKETIPNNFGKDWLGNVAYNFGLDYKDYSCEGSIEDFFEDITEDKDPVTGKPVYSFFFNYYSIGDSCPDMFEDALNLFNKKCNTDISQAYLIGEPDISIYRKHDPMGIFYKEQYVTDVTGEDKHCSHMFNSETTEDTVDQINSLLEDYDIKGRITEQDIPISEFRNDEIRSKEIVLDKDGIKQTDNSSLHIPSNTYIKISWIKQI